MIEVVPDVLGLAGHLRDATGSGKVAARGWAFGLASSAERSYGIGIYGVEPEYEPAVSIIPGLVQDGRYLANPDAMEIVVGAVLARNLRAGVGDELTILGSGLDGSFAAAVVRTFAFVAARMPKKPARTEQSAPETNAMLV